MAEPADLRSHYVVAGYDGRIAIQPKTGPPPRTDGYTFGLHDVAADSPHGGELHPDADEVLFVVSGVLTAVLQHDDRPHERVLVHAGDVVVIPAGVWHRLEVAEPTRLLHLTPGPSFDVRPIESHTTEDL